MTILYHIGHHWRGSSEFIRWGSTPPRAIRKQNKTSERKTNMKTRHTINTALLIGLLFFGRAAPLLAQNLLINGDFEAGNTGFTSGYTYSPGAIEPQGTY